MIESIFDIFFEIFHQLINVVFDFAVGLFEAPKSRKTMYDADFLDESTILSSENKGFCLTGKRNLSIEDSYMHSLILGGSGSGKSSTVILNSLFNIARGGSSIFCHDPSGELLEKSQAYLESLGYEIKLLSFANEQTSDGYNPLERVKTYSDIQKVATIIVRNSLGEGSGDSSFWNSQTIAFLSLIIAILKKQEPKYCNLSNCKYLVDIYQNDKEFLDTLVVQTKDENILREYKSFLNYESKVMSNIISSARSCLTLFSDDVIQKITSHDTLNFEDLRTKKIALFLTNKTSQIKFYAPLSSLLAEQLFAFIMDEIPNKATQKSIFFLLDEMSSIVLPTLQIALSNLRKYACGMMLVCQDFNQIIHIYGAQNAEAIRTNCYAKVYFPNQPTNTCKELQELVGKYEFEDENGRYKIRPLLTSDEIRSMPTNTALIFCGSHRPIYAKMHPYYLQKKLLQYSLMKTSQKRVTNLPEVSFIKSAKVINE